MQKGSDTVVSLSVYKRCGNTKQHWRTHGVRVFGRGVWQQQRNKTKWFGGWIHSGSVQKWIGIVWDRVSLEIAEKFESKNEKFEKSLGVKFESTTANRVVKGPLQFFATCSCVSGLWNLCLVRSSYEFLKFVLKKAEADLTVRIVNHSIAKDCIDDSCETGL